VEVSRRPVDNSRGNVWTIGELPGPLARGAEFTGDFGDPDQVEVHRRRVLAEQNMPDMPASAIVRAIFAASLPAAAPCTTFLNAALECGSGGQCSRAGEVHWYGAFGEQRPHCCAV
jgi:hypothetical protein